MFLMFSLRRPDVLPGGDLGIRNAVAKGLQGCGPGHPSEDRGNRSRMAALLFGCELVSLAKPRTDKSRSQNR